jgi:hypothetical protein
MLFVVVAAAAAVCLFGCSVQENVKALLVKMNVYKILD